MPALSETYAGHAGYSWVQYGGSVVLLLALTLCAGPGLAAGAARSRSCRPRHLGGLGRGGRRGSTGGTRQCRRQGDLRTVAYFVVTRSCALPIATVLVLACAWHVRRVWVISAG